MSATALTLIEAYRYHFPDDSTERLRDRCAVLAADLCDDGFGLSSRAFDDLARSAEAVYHFAADTRLMGPREQFIRTNIDATKRVLAFASIGKSKHVHHMSTLAVSGFSSENRHAQFSEHVLDIGQEFQNDYELSKYQAERLIRTFILDGGTASIYRTGNVFAANSGIFQRNSHDNRLVQTLSAILEIGRVPQDLGDPFTLSPVDIVAAGVVALSLDPRCFNGTYHIESPHLVQLMTLVDQLRAIGWPLVSDETRNLNDLFADTDNLSQTVLIARHWSSRGRRNIAVNSETTLRKLADIGIDFEPPSSTWLRNALHKIFGTPLSVRKELPEVCRICLATGKYTRSPHCAHAHQ